MNDEQLLRYSRHIFLPEVDLDGQQKIQAAKLLVIGLGGLGSAALPYLVGSGVGTITLVDDDYVELSNLPRQIIHNTTGIGVSKVTSAIETLQRSEEHTSELQSRPHLVCRLLLEKKKTTIKTNNN